MGKDPRLGSLRGIDDRRSDLSVKGGILRVDYLRWQLLMGYFVLVRLILIRQPLIEEHRLNAIPGLHWENRNEAKMIYQWEEPGILTWYPEKKEEKAVESEIEEEYKFSLMFTQDGPAGEQGMVSMIIANPVAKDPSTLIIPEHYAIGGSLTQLFESLTKPVPRVPLANYTANGTW
ncbi:hypothetical protein SASPL_155490 (mitochondrion) [Salvia splendens]|uniref:Uncharacterized protein n=1 Tax=Salvia splendens TaxID=180675 RepID=A0A8X8VWU7_SALSN|nr:hypothetical protein SASPL_156297 [Salvia splendens]KAG6384647.1 hypothetical protein SASPL_155490 [Salvia splendens]